MVTYGDLFTFVIMLCAVVTLVITFMHKKQRPRPGKIKALFLVITLAGGQVYADQRFSC